MNGRRVVLAALTAAFLASVAVEIINIRRTHRTEADTASLIRRNAELRKMVANLDCRRSAAQERQAELRAALIRLGKRTGNSDDRPPASPGRVNSRAALASDPKLLAPYLHAFRESLLTKYGPLFRTLGLSPEQIEKFQDLKVRIEQNSLSLEAATAAHGVNPNGTAYLAMGQEINNQNEDLEDAFFEGDPATIAQYREYQNVQAARDLAYTVATNSAFSDGPLTSDQAEQLTAILAANSQRSKSGGVVAGTINWDAAAVQAQGILTAPQLTALESLRQQTELQQQINTITKDTR
jgi:hypothetical protein